MAKGNLSVNSNSTRRSFIGNIALLSFSGTAVFARGRESGSSARSLRDQIRQRNGGVSSFKAKFIEVPAAGASEDALAYSRYELRFDGDSYLHTYYDDHDSPFGFQLRTRRKSIVGTIEDGRPVRAKMLSGKEWPSDHQPEFLPLPSEASVQIEENHPRAASDRTALRQGRRMFVIDDKTVDVVEQLDYEDDGRLRRRVAFFGHHPCGSGYRVPDRMEITVSPPTDEAEPALSENLYLSEVQVWPVKNSDLIRTTDYLNALAR